MNRFKHFYTDNRDKLFGYLLRKSGSVPLAADLAQESFTRYFERYRTQKESPALLFTIGRNLFYDHVRQQPIFVEHKEEIGQVSVMGQEEIYIAKEESAVILEALQKLSDDERDILSLVVSSNMKYQEIAEIRGCTVANIKVKVHRARKKLKELLKETNHE